ncbi:lysylphosphatidylglycerol synthase transmembrane domain-containing protein [Nocardioides sp. HM23]|uniref:lysylphosphatidylglycerol synthase transmembrane domain-containing protein n=1 Tax=Nocardioides bizhenqiangii TaxID=3095076 RepID=UPI002AC9F3AD|nr:lysylphosphatidylglycerol synthase transmembrane domain-containing protein [Nocardioides sp. HM23]MDZ5619198.1 lysylphosphatidylglycerol synthase transmembrane domain-containing protein [Nocardioides sp. HM23]
MNRWARVRLMGGVLILGVLAVRLGAEPFVEGIRSTDATTLVVALAVTAATTWCCAWRWSLLAARLDVAVPVRTAYRRYYRSQLLNATLPGGVLGDVHRGIDHGRSAGALGRGLRSVLWERTSGQAVQVALALAALLLLPAAVRAEAGWLLLAVATVLVVVAAALPARVRRAVAAELRAVVAARAVLPRVVLASALAAVGHVVVLVVVARSVGVTAPLPELVALSLVVLVASALPLSVAGWGPREGAAAWLFGAAGLGVDTGVSVAVAFGVVSLVATLPGMLTLAGGTQPTTRSPDSTPEEAVHG